MTSFADSCCVLQFAKLPEAGKVKTRMRPLLSESLCQKLHETLTEQIFLTLSSPLEPGFCWSYQLWVSRSPEAGFFRRLSALAERTVPVVEQQGRDLGERMSNAFRQTLQYYRYVILIGSDCPSLTPTLLQDMFVRLRRGCDSVLVPALDGGYVAIGCRVYLPGLFQAVDWGTERVFSQTIAKLNDADVVYECLPTMADIDRPEDLLVWSGYQEFILKAET